MLIGASAPSFDASARPVATMMNAYASFSPFGIAPFQPRFASSNVTCEMPPDNPEPMTGLRPSAARMSLACSHVSYQSASTPSPSVPSYPPGAPPAQAASSNNG